MVTYWQLLKQANPPQPRKNSAARGYGRAWQKARERRLAENPLCLDCLAEGRATPATQVHHIAKVAAAPDLIYDRENLRPLCAACHSTRTARGE